MARVAAYLLLGLAVTASPSTVLAYAPSGARSYFLLHSRATWRGLLRSTTTMTAADPAARRAVSIGVDVGTGSARAGVVDVASGALLAVRKRDIRMWEPRAEHYEQSSDDIWAAVCACVRGALADAAAADGGAPAGGGIDINDDALEVVGLGFDATCSLVALDADDLPARRRRRGGLPATVVTTPSANEPHTHPHIPVG